MRRLFCFYRVIYEHEIARGVGLIDKKSLRQAQIKKLNQTKQQTKAEAVELLAKLRETPEWKNAQTIATTVSNLFEVPTKPIILAAIEDGKKVYLPKTMPHRQMSFLPFNSYDELVVSKFGIPEPVYDEKLENQEPDLVLVPGLAFAQDSHFRVGFGGGYYDRFLQNYQGATVALVPSAMYFEKTSWDVENFDIKITKLITLD